MPHPPIGRNHRDAADMGENTSEKKQLALVSMLRIGQVADVTVIASDARAGGGMAEPFLGEIKIFGFGFIPRGYIACDGRLLQIRQFQALYMLLGPLYGGDGAQTFGIPDFRGRTPLNASSSLRVATLGGSETVALSEATMPAHTHSLSGTSQTATQRPVNGGAFANDTSLPVDFYAPVGSVPLVPLSLQTLASSGGSQPHNNMQPYQVLNICIAVQGIFPSRN